MRPEHKRMSRMLGFALTLGTGAGWADFSTLARLRMTETERGALAYATLSALDRDKAEAIVAEFMGAAGEPLPAFLGGMDDARDWASLAARPELKAYALAAFEAMSARDQAAFFRHISEMEIAA